MRSLCRAARTREHVMSDLVARPSFSECSAKHQRPCAQLRSWQCHWHVVCTAPCAEWRLPAQHPFEPAVLSTRIATHHLVGRLLLSTIDTTPRAVLDLDPVGIRACPAKLRWACTPRISGCSASYSRSTFEAHHRANAVLHLPSYSAVSRCVLRAKKLLRLA